MIVDETGQIWFDFGGDGDGDWNIGRSKRKAPIKGPFLYLMYARGLRLVYATPEVW